MATMEQQTLSGIRSRLSQAMSPNWDEDPTARALGRRIASAYDVMAWNYLQSLDRAGARVARLQAVQHHAAELVGSIPARNVLSILNDQISAELGDDPSTIGQGLHLGSDRACLGKAPLTLAERQVLAAVLRPMKAAQE
jgi:hypothetical protein